MAAIKSAAYLTGAGALMLSSVACAQTAEPVAQGIKNVPEFEPAFPEQTRAPAAPSDVTLAQETIADGLVHPWGVAVLPDGGYLVTERPGRLRVISANGTVSDPIEGLPDLVAQKQGGLLDIAVDPNFATDRMIYWTYSKPLGDGMSGTAAARGRLSEDNREVTEVQDIFVQEPPSPDPMHYGSRIVLDGAGTAYVTTGEHFTMDQRVYAQDLDKTYGKVVRVNLDGSTPYDNPFVAQDGAIETIWSYGHRNIQGAAMRPETNEFWLVEHGPQGGDELNKVEAGKNYGWPVVSYGETYQGNPVGEGVPRKDGMEEPRYYWDPVIAPGGMIFYDGEMFPDWQGDVFIASLVDGKLVRLEMSADTVVGEERLLDGQARVRDVAIDIDGGLLILTDEENGALIKLTPQG